MNKNNLLKSIIRAIITVVLCIAAGYALMVLVYMLPTSVMKQNIKSSTNIFDTEREYHRVIPGYISTQLDNYTDAWMVSNAVYESPESVWKAALSCSRAEYGEGPLDALIRYENDEQGYEVTDYARYWHGYLVVLKPLFLIFGYADLRVINIILESLLVLFVFTGLRKRGFTGEAYAYIAAVMFIMPIVIPLSIQFSVMFYISNMAALILLEKYEEIKQKQRLFWYFELVGIAVSFFDFLTYPIAALGMPVVCMLIIEGASFDIKALFSKIIDIVKCSVSFGFGYITMWFGKWVLSTLILGDNIIADAFNQILMRSSHVTEGEEIDIIHTWLRNVEFYFEKPYMIFILISVLIAAAGIIKNIKNLKNMVLNAVPYIITALMPFAWYGVATQHSYEHHWFTFRGTCVSVFAFLCAVICIYKYNKNPHYGDKS